MKNNDGIYCKRPDENTFICKYKKGGGVVAKRNKNGNLEFINKGLTSEQYAKMVENMKQQIKSRDDLNIEKSNTDDDPFDSEGKSGEF